MAKRFHQLLRWYGQNSRRVLKRSAFCWFLLLVSVGQRNTLPLVVNGGCCGPPYLTNYPQASRDAIAMYALRPKADMCGAKGNVRFVPIADINGHSVGQGSFLESVSVRRDIFGPTKRCKVHCSREWRCRIQLANALNCFFCFCHFAGKRVAGRGKLHYWTTGRLADFSEP